MTSRVEYLGRAVVCLVGPALLLVACGSEVTRTKAGDEAAAAARPGGTGGTGGTGGAGDITTPEECLAQAYGGMECHSCDAVTLYLSEPLPLSGLEVELETRMGDRWTEFDDPPLKVVSLVVSGDPVNVLFLRRFCAAPYTPEWVDVVLRHGGVEVANEHVDNIDYRCIHLGGGNYCWEAAPVTVPITRP